VLLQEDTPITRPPIQLDDNLQDTLDRHPATVRVFVGRRMACPGCTMAQFETVADAADAYELQHDELLADLRRADAAIGATPDPSADP
jgi:hybrid cluster-associated redox disulfide protein